MPMSAKTYCFDQLHIDVARNTTDDFNPFHDPLRWRNIRDNPFGSTIALGFQTEFLVSHLVERHRQAHGEHQLPARHGLCFDNYEFSFATALRPGDGFGVDVRKTVDRTPRGGGLSNRVVVRKPEGDLVLMGTQSASPVPRALGDLPVPVIPGLPDRPDRAMLAGSDYFLKRKHLNTSNGKNFVLAGLVDQHEYFDELAGRVTFPPMFCAALLSCALLEKGWQDGYDFEADPVVYTSHQISIDRRLQRRLASNDTLHLLVDGPIPVPVEKGLGKVPVEQQAYQCLVLVYGSEVLLRARLLTAPLHALMSA